MIQREYLQTLCNRFGDFKVAHARVDKDGTKRWSKWHSVLECWEHKSGLSFLDRVNNRTILPIEIVLDMDSGISIDRVNKLCDALEEEYESYVAFETGSKGYHIHIINLDLAREKVETRQLIRSVLMKKYSLAYRFDCQKVSEKTMIALEYAPHWKTGKEKKMVRCFGEWAGLLMK